MTSDFKDLLRSLCENKVEFMVIGGHAVMILSPVFLALNLRIRGNVKLSHRLMKSQYRLYQRMI